MAARKIKRVPGDRFVLCRFSLRFGPMVEESGPELGPLLAEIPDHLDCGDDERLSVCEVGYWTVYVDGDPSDWTPRDLTTLYEIQHYADPEDD
jgi:hypothetical protein